MARVLVHKATGTRAVIGETLTDFRGDQAVMTGSELPRHAGSTGRVYVREVNSPADRMAQGFYPSVFDLEWKDTTYEQA